MRHLHLSANHVQQNIWSSLRVQRHHHMPERRERSMLVITNTLMEHESHSTAITGYRHMDFCKEQMAKQGDGALRNLISVSS